jgi:hypothetical protein
MARDSSVNKRSTNCHAPRKRGIQYPSAVALIEMRWLLDRPLSRAMTRKLMELVADKS